MPFTTASRTSSLAILLSFLPAPVVRRLEHWRLGRIAATFIAVAIGCSLIGGIGLIAARQALSRLPDVLALLR